MFLKTTVDAATSSARGMDRKASGLKLPDPLSLKQVYQKSWETIAGETDRRT